MKSNDIDNSKMESNGIGNLKMEFNGGIENLKRCIGRWPGNSPNINSTKNYQEGAW